MVLFVTSSPYVNDADRAILSNDNEFIDRIRAVLPPCPRALFIAADPANREDTSRFAADTTGAFSEAGMPFQSYHILDGFNVEDAEALIAGSDLILLSGGHVPTQNAFFQEIGLRGLMERFDGVVVGISAGSMNAAQTVYVQPELPGESTPEFPRFLPGLGLTDVMLIPHFQAIREDVLDSRRLIEEITFADSFGHAFCALEDGSYLLIEDGRTTLCGAAWCISNGWLEKINEDGEITRL